MIDKGLGFRGRRKCIRTRHLRICVFLSEACRELGWGWNVTGRERWAKLGLLLQGFRKTFAVRRFFPGSQRPPRVT